jgi:hypothetical protein
MVTGGFARRNYLARGPPSRGRPHRPPGARPVPNEHAAKSHSMGATPPKSIDGLPNSARCQTRNHGRHASSAVRTNGSPIWPNRSFASAGGGISRENSIGGVVRFALMCGSQARGRESTQRNKPLAGIHVRDDPVWVLSMVRFRSQIPSVSSVAD